ncbi:hypothetical protein E3N88_36537 [Mikania micrantha]|uniref:glutathione transferase n=1 Tax=Mikania micrantha TaxID=192012 RepID=A0A5N6M454_9ASTR|nr:hypothetical protein E3N88_36537 [Mikania micrantha]
MALKLHGSIFSLAGLRVLVALYEKDLDFEFVQINMSAREHKTPQAITRYISEVYADKGTDLISKDPMKLAIQAVWMEVEGQKFQVVTTKLLVELFFKPMNGRTTDESVVAEFEKQLESMLDVYEQRLTESKYLGGDRFSLPDLHHLPNLQTMMMTKMKRHIDSRPHVSAWASDILSRPSWIKVQAMQSE